jgi:DNA polymerase III delta prime subunit
MPIRQPLNEKYRPNTASEYVFQDENVKQRVEKWCKDKTIPNVLLEGVQGTGKSSLARVLIHDIGIDPVDVKIVNGSSQGIGYIREVVEPWLKKTSLSPFKVVLIEEADALSRSSQKMLRMVTEDNIDHVRWILTCNYVEKITPPLLSRFEAGYITLNAMNEDGVVDLVLQIINGEHIDFDNDEDIMSHIRAHAPDIRKIINSIDGALDANNWLHPARRASESHNEDEWVSLWANGDITLERALRLSSLISMENYEQFYQTMYENSRNFPDQGRGIVLCSQYLDRATTSANQKLHLDAFLYHLFEVADE